MRPTILLLVLALTLPLAGCLGGDEGGGNVGTASTDDPTVSPGNTTTNGTSANATHPHAWNRTTIEGSVTGGYAPVVGAGFTNSGGDEAWNVTGTVHIMHVNLTATGELNVYIYPPGCENDDNVAGAPCATSNTTENGEVRFTVEDADEGEWTIELYRQDGGYGTTDYTIEIAQYVEV